MDYTKKIANFYKTNKRMPSYSEIMRLAGFKSKNAAYRLAKRLIGEGVIGKDRSGKLIPGSLFGSIRMLGTIQAGFPSPAEEELGDTMTLDEFLVDRPESTFLMKVTGESMLDAGILPGDLVLVERNPNPRNGQIVIAAVDGEWTMKYYVKNHQTVMLMPGNKKFRPIIPHESLRIAAIVKAVIRKY